MITKEQIIEVLNKREENIDGGETLGIHCVNYGNVADAILKLLSEPPASSKEETVSNSITVRLEKIIADLEHDKNTDAKIRNKWYTTGLDKAIIVVQSYLKDETLFPTAATTPSKGVEDLLKNSMFMNGGNTDTEKGFYELGFKAGYTAYLSRK